jgi:hypothetical protein
MASTTEYRGPAGSGNTFGHHGETLLNATEPGSITGLNPGSKPASKPASNTDLKPGSIQDDMTVDDVTFCDVTFDGLSVDDAVVYGDDSQPLNSDDLNSVRPGTRAFGGPVGEHFLNPVEKQPAAAYSDYFAADSGTGAGEGSGKHGHHYRRTHRNHQ